ncbi:MAG TPA: nuclear transport factor 2 family protein, partial [Anaeromyxobacter sp.]
DVLGHAAAEAAGMLETSVAAVNGALRRARATLDAELPRGAPGLDRSDGTELELLARYVRAWEAGDAGAIAALLREDAILSMPPDVLWFRGREAIAAYLARGPLAGDPRGRFRLLPLGANAQPAFALYHRAEDGVHRALAIMVLALRGGAVAEITGFLDGRLFPRFGVAAEFGRDG